MALNGARISDIMPTALSLFSDQYSPRLSTRATPGTVDQVVVWLIDGLGYDQLTRALARGLMPRLQDRLLSQESHLESLTTVNPSMTPVALASLLTGSDPAQHGLIGQSLYCDHQVIDVFKSPIPQSLALAQDLVAESAEALGIHYQAILEHRILKGPLTQLLHRNTRHLSTYIRDSGLSVVLNQALAENRTGIFYLYSSGIDAVNHRRGVESDEWVAEIEALDRQLDQFTAPSGQTTWLWITADHGHIPIRGELSYPLLVDQLPSLPPIPAEIGSAVSVDVEDMSALKRALANFSDLPIDVVAVADLVDQHYFGRGDVSPFLSRLGDYLLVPPSGFIWHTTSSEPLAWSHGGSHPGEMTIPWFECRL